MEYDELRFQIGNNCVSVRFDPTSKSREVLGLTVLGALEKIYLKRNEIEAAHIRLHKEIMLLRSIVHPSEVARVNREMDVK